MKRDQYKPGLPPGTIIDRDEVVYPLNIAIIDYGRTSIERRDGADIAEVLPPEPTTYRWIRILGTPTSELITQLGEHFGVHPLVQEDIIATDQRIKVEDYEACSFTSLKVLRHAPEHVEECEMSLLLTEHSLITIFESDDERFFAPIWQRLANPGSLVRERAVDFLYHAVVDLVVDCYFPVVQRLEILGSETESLILSGAEEEHLRSIHAVRSSAQSLRGSLWSLRDVITRIERTTHRFVSEGTLFYFRDIGDHVVHLLDSVANLREAANAMMELYMSQVSNRMNQVMKVLTIISTLFIPITFVAGVYGMNFRVMPELEVAWAYPAALGVMGIIVVGMLIFFRRKGWF